MFFKTNEGNTNLKENNKNNNIIAKPKINIIGNNWNLRFSNESMLFYERLLLLNVQAHCIWI